MKKILSVAAVLFLLSIQIVMAQGELCTADFNCDQNVDATDVDTFLSQFGRNPFNDPCPDCYDSPCPCTLFPCDPPAPVKKSGQTTSYATGDDGDHEKGVAWPNPRYTDNSDGTVKDNLTGLIWLKDANCFAQRSWDNALSDCNGLASGSCGLTDGSSAGDWRLPNLIELDSLRDLTNTFPAVSDTAGTGHWSQGDPFNNVENDLYWSSTTESYSSDRVWYMLMSSGMQSAGNKSGNLYVWPVRDPL